MKRALSSNSGYSVMYNYVRARQLEGTYPGPPDIGVWQVTSLRIMKGWGVLAEAYWPYDGDATRWPPTEPKDADALAKERRILAYCRVRTIDECKRLLANNCLVMAAFEIDERWFAAHAGVIDIPGSQPIVAAHSITIHGYNDHVSRFTFANSWGQQWGDNGHGQLPYEYWDVRLLEAWCILEGVVEHPKLSGPNRAVRSWGIDDRLGGCLHAVEVVDSSCDEVVGWTLGTDRGNYLDVEELFVRPHWRGQGFGTILANELKRLAIDLDKDVCIWIPHADFEHAQSPQFRRLLKRLNVHLKPSGNRWAAALAI